MNYFFTDARGGSWNFDPQFVRTAMRSDNNSSYRCDDIGFRVALKEV
jgi:formylglycine-generating enzyme required for sulfatase activity